MHTFPTIENCTGLTVTEEGFHRCRCGADAVTIGAQSDTGSSRFVCLTTGRPLGSSGL